MAEAVAGIALEKAADSLFGVAKKKIGYMWNCKQNVENLKTEVESLKVVTRQVQQQIDIAKGKGDNLLSGVEEWLGKASDEISEAEVFLGEFLNAKKTCFKIGMCGNWATLYHYGKGATEMMTPLKEHKESGTQFVTCVSVETAPPTRLDVYKTKNLEDLLTHNAALNAIIAALEDESKQIIGIYGLGGVGKTTLAMEVAARVKKTNMLFAAVAFTTVSQTVNAEKIKKDIEEATKRIMNGDKILIILDDVWEKLNLEELCIPINRTNCRILLTSRNEDVCEKMNSQINICVNSLPTEEAWILFKRVVGERVETEVDLKPIAAKVAKECGGLPLLIKAVGNALKNKSIGSWQAALSRLQKAAPLEIDPDIRKAFTRLRLSYDYLESEEAKSCFLLCSMFPEDSNIELEDLVFYMVGGLEKFDNLESMEDARYRVQDAVNMLTSSCLLLNTEQEGYTKMHDVVRDVALLISSVGENKYLVKAGKSLTEWQPKSKSVESYAGISLMHNDISKLPDYEVHLSGLDIFLVQKNDKLSMISDTFVEGIKEVKVLDMKGCHNARFPQSLKLLTKLRVLNLGGNRRFHEISILGEMKELEILILNRTGIKEIPEELGGLVHLRRLELLQCSYLTHVTSGVISKLESLEELRIDLRLLSEFVNGCTAEVTKLSKLRYLYLQVNNLNLIHEGFNLENLKGFEIIITYFSGSYEFGGPISEIDEPGILESELQPIEYPSWSDRRLSISGEHLVIPKWVKKLIEGSRPTTIHLDGIENLNNIMPTLYDEGFNKLECIKLYRCYNMSCLVDDGSDGDEWKIEEKFFKELKHLFLCQLHNMEVLWKCPGEYISLTNLVSVRIEGCLSLKTVFTVSVAIGLVNLVRLHIETCSKLETVFAVGVAQSLVSLKELKIQKCYNLKAVIWEGDSGDHVSGNIIEFPSLAEISLFKLGGLKSFYYGENYSMKYPSLMDVRINNCRSMQYWGHGIHETPNLKSLGRKFGGPILLGGPNAINDAVRRSNYT